MMNLTNKRETFFDDAIINCERTTAEHFLHHPIRRDTVLIHDQPWEGDSCFYHNFFYDNGIYRMYYVALDSSSSIAPNSPEKVVICYAQSKDGIHWEKPELDICEFSGSKKNNIILNCSMVYNSTLDNFMVFKDENSNCTPDRRYKAVTLLKRDGKSALHSMYSADGIHFTYGNELTDKGLFDSLNIAFWDKNASVYRCYLRGFHTPGCEDLCETNEDCIRDIRYMESQDFINWTTPKLLNFGDSEDIALYTNVVQPCPGAEHILIGFPSRYVYRRSWTANFDELCGKKARKERMKDFARYGLTVTDCAFMVSRDGLHFKRYGEAFLRPGPEYKDNWIYGTCYPARGFVQTPSSVSGADNELSMFFTTEYWCHKPAALTRYTIRQDGFVSMHSGEKEKMLVTKPFIFKGENMYINFETSALGYMYFSLIDEHQNRYESCEIFGDKVDRKVSFDDGVVKTLSQKPVTLEVRMRDADLYSIMFR